MEMNEKQALFLIEEMIGKAKNEIRDNGFYFLLWGWLVFIAAAINYYLLVFTDVEIHSLPWMILMPLGGIVTWIGSAREVKKVVKVKTYIDDLMKLMVRAFTISLFVVCFAMPFGQQWRAFYPTIMVVYSIWLYVSGGMLKFKPLVLGGFLNWLLAAIGFMFPSTELHLVLIGLAVLGGYIIPGYLLKRRYHQDVKGT
jgi:hypothetical protein